MSMHLFYRGQELIGEPMHGPFPGGDPRRFVPDQELNTPAEIARWEEACARWDAGEPTTEGRQCMTLGDGSLHDDTGFGFGIYCWPVEAEEAD